MSYDYEFEHLFEEVEKNGKLYSVEVTVGYDAEMVDNGIGPYEFWGARGTDVLIEVEIGNNGIISIDKIEDEDGNIVDPETVSVSDIENWLKPFYQKGYNDSWNPARWYDEAIQSEAEQQVDSDRLLS